MIYAAAAFLQETFGYISIVFGNRADGEKEESMSFYSFFFLEEVLGVKMEF